TRAHIIGDRFVVSAPRADDEIRSPDNTARDGDDEVSAIWIGRVADLLGQGLDDRRRGKAHNWQERRVRENLRQKVQLREKSREIDVEITSKGIWDLEGQKTVLVRRELFERSFAIGVD